ncbi:hypothetical protein Q3G72_034745 [Acer saccharum]|nr:hypothetical protein Q3G72_034745 [Acer saccharum]
MPPPTATILPSSSIPHLCLDCFSLVVDATWSNCTFKLRQRHDKFSIFRIICLGLVENEEIVLRFLVTTWLLWHNMNRILYGGVVKELGD